MRRVDGDRRQDRKHLILKKLFQPGSVLVGDVLAIEHLNAFSIQRIAQLGPLVVLALGNLGDHLVDARKLFLRRKPVLTHLGDTFGDVLAQTSHTDDIKLVEIRGADREKAQTLQERVVRVGRLFKNPAIELKPGKLPIVEAVGTLKLRRDRGVGIRQFFCKCHLFSELRQFGVYNLDSKANRPAAPQNGQQSGA